MWGDIAIAFLLAFITAYVVTPYTIRLARKVGAIDVPKDKRKIHKYAKPRLGGLAVIAGFIVSTIYLLIVMSIEGSITLTGPDNYYIKLIGFFCGGLVLGIFCYIDDLKDIPPYVKLIGQILAATIVTLSGIRIDKIVISSLGETIINSEILSIIITIIWIVGITNAINLIDGLDGLSSGICLISCLSLLIILH
jgi:UDP-GlcNAc:undecaprenyl-phosphate GlcNAc-1-phosphate transferase